MTTQDQGLEVVEQRTQLIAPHNGGKLTFLHPPYGHGTYANVGSGIETDKLKRPTMAETASLVYASFNSPEDSRYIRYSNEIKDIIRQALLWAYTLSKQYTLRPINGVFVYDESNGERFSGLNGSKLEQMLGQRQEHGVVYSDDGLLRFIQFGYKVGEMSSLELAKNSYVIALAGEEGAEKLAGIADKYRNKPYLLSFKSVDRNMTRVSAISSRDSGRRLSVGGYGIGNHGVGRAFGVLK